MPVVTTLSGETISVDLETRDFEGFRSDVLDPGGLADTYAPDWTDRSELDLGVALTEAFAFMADNLAYYQDRWANEALFPSAVQRRSVIEHCKLIGYELSPAVSARVELTFVTSAAGTVPARTKVLVDTSDGSDPATFELVSDFIAAGAGITTGVLAYEGSSVSEVIGSSDGSPDQSYALSSTPLALNPDGSSSLEVTVTVGFVDQVWTEVDNFLESGSSDQHFRTEIDENDVVTVIFGDGVNGEIPAGGVDNISAVYRVGGGISGNQIATNKLTRLVGSFAFVTSVTNPAAPTGGINRETISQAKINAPLSLKALNRAVTHDDYRALALEVPGVLHAYAFRGVGSYEERVVIAGGGSDPIPAGTWDPYTETGTDLIGAVGEYLNARKTTPVILYVDPVRVVDVRLIVNSYLYTNTRQADALRVIEDAIEALFAPENQVLGQQVPLSRVHEVIEGLNGIDYVDVVQMQRVPNPRKLPFGSNTDLVIGDFIVGPTTLAETYTLSFLNATDFEIIGTASGYQGSGSIGSAFTTNDTTLTFTITAGAIPPSNTDKWEIVTGPYVGNINPDNDEMVSLYNDTFQNTVYGGIS
jgi:hypothetical protein